METDWTRDRDWGQVVYTKSRYFNGCKYCVFISVESKKCTKYSVGVSSGKKRKHLDIFEEKDSKSSGGIAALLWIKQMIYEFPKWYNENYIVIGKQYLIIGWADSKRRNVYSRLLNEGFVYMIEYNRKVLRKEL